MRRMCFIMMLPFKCLSDEYRREHRKDECLQKGHQYFNHINKHREPDGKRRGGPASGHIQFSGNENEGDQTDNDNVSGHHVREKTNDKGEWLDEHAQELHRHQDEFYSQGYAGRIEDMPPVMLVGTEHDHHKGNHTQYRCKGNIAGYIGRSGNQSEYIIDQDEKEYS